MRTIVHLQTSSQSQKTAISFHAELNIGCYYTTNWNESAAVFAYCCSVVKRDGHACERMWDTLHTAFDRSSGTLCTVGAGWCGRFVAWQRPVGGTTVTTDQQQVQLRRNKTERRPAELKATCIPIATQQLSNAVTSRLVVLISTFYKLHAWISQ